VPGRERAGEITPGGSTNPAQSSRPPAKMVEGAFTAADAQIPSTTSFCTRAGGQAIRCTLTCARTGVLGTDLPPMPIIRGRPAKPVRACGHCFVLPHPGNHRPGQRFPRRHRGTRTAVIQTTRDGSEAAPVEAGASRTRAPAQEGKRSRSATARRRNLSRARASTDAELAEQRQLASLERSKPPGLMVHQAPRGCQTEK